MMKKLSLVLSMVATLLCSGLAQAAEKKEVVVGFANRTLNGAYFAALSEHVKQFGEAAGYKIILTDARADFTKQVADCEDMVAQGINYLLLNPQDPMAGIQIARNAAAKGIKVLTIDSDISLEAPVVTRILPDNAGNNLLIGEYAAKAAGKTPIKLSLISGNQGNLVGRARSTNFILGIIEGQLRDINRTEMVILTQVWGNWDQAGGLKAMEDVLVAQPETNTVYAENDDMALGAYRAVFAAGKQGKVNIYSYDGNKNAYKAIVDGQLMATGENNPEKMAKAAIEIISKLEAGETRFNDYTVMPTLMVNKDNAKKIYNPKSLF